VTGKQRTSGSPVGVTATSMAGIVFKELRELECLLHALLYGGVALLEAAG